MISAKITIDPNIRPQFVQERTGVRRFRVRVEDQGKCVYGGDAVIAGAGRLVPSPALWSKKAGQTRITIVSGDAWPESKPATIILHQREGDRQLAVREEKDGQLFVMVPGGLGTAKRPVRVDTVDDSGMQDFPRMTVVLDNGTKLESILRPW